MATEIVEKLEKRVVSLKKQLKAANADRDRGWAAYNEESTLRYEFKCEVAELKELVFGITKFVGDHCQGAQFD